MVIILSDYIFDDKMKAWEQSYDEKVLNEALNIIGDVKIVHNDGIEIIAEIESFAVTTYIQYNGPTHASCNCSESGGCKHEASLIYYLKDHPEIYVKDLDLNDILDNVDKKNLKKFLLKEFEYDNELKSRFLSEFQKNSIDKTYYRNKLSKIFKTGEGKEFEYHEIYDLDLMENGLYDFLFDDISKIMSAGEFDFACELLCRIAELLNDELMSSYDSWDNLVDRLMEHVNVLSSSIYLDSQKMDELYSNMDIIFDIF